MAGEGVRIEGASEVASALERLADQLADPKDALVDLSRQTATWTRAWAPRRTGRLAQSVRPVVRPGSAGALVGDKGRLSYAAFPAYGTRYQRASPWLKRVDVRLEAVAADRIERDIDSIIRREGLT